MKIISAYQIFHKVEVEVINIMFKEGELNSIIVKYPQNYIPRRVTYRANDNDYPLYVDDKMVLEFEIEL